MNFHAMLLNIVSKTCCAFLQGKLRGSANVQAGFGPGSRGHDDAFPTCAAELQARSRDAPGDWLLENC